MISRVWHGWTTPANADAYEALLKSEIFTGIRDRQIAGYRGTHLFRRNIGDEVEFVTVMWFDTIEAVRAFAGEDYEVAVVPQRREHCFHDLMHVRSTMKLRLKLRPDKNFSSIWQG